MTSVRAADPRTGEEFGPAFVDATPKEIAAAATAAAQAFAHGMGRSAQICRAVAEALEDDREGLVAIADAETALGRPRLEGELSRATGQFRAFADLVEEGSYVEAVIDSPDPSANPARPDLRKMLVPVGPAAVFGASNFPFAFGVPGGDTASALAAGCPVIAKAHPSHPGTSQRAADAIIIGCAAAHAPEGTFTLIHGAAPDVGATLVTDPRIAAVGFTGSESGGRALADLGAARPRPIPVYAEMGSLNPVFVTAAALRERGATIAEGFVASMTLGTGQFCTKPGLVFVPRDAEAFTAAVAERITAAPAGHLLNSRITAALEHDLDRLTQLPGVEMLASGVADAAGYAAAPVVLTCDLDTFAATAELREEHFGPVAIVVRCGNERTDFLYALATLPGGLTATLHGAEGDLERTDLHLFLKGLRERAGRLLWNGFPTGVAVTPAQHHGGPYPASTWPAHTSVGTAAIRRFLRPVAYQSFPEALLPPALRDANPLGIRRLVDGRLVNPSA